MFPDVCVVWGLFWGDVPGHARMAEAHASPDPVPTGPCYLLSAMQKLCSWWVPPDLHEKAFSGDISRYAKSKGTAPEFCVYCTVMSITPSSCLSPQTAYHQQDRQTERAQGQGGQRRKIFIISLKLIRFCSI